VPPRKRPEFDIKWDTAGLFTIGQVIPVSRYNSVKEEYDLRMKEWDGDDKTPGEGIFHISGSKRDAIRGFLEEKRYVITPEYFHYAVRARGKNVDPTAISKRIQEQGLKFLWVHVIGETGPESDSGRR
jgi:hypothetical protein